MAIKNIEKSIDDVAKKAKKASLLLGKFKQSDFDKALKKMAVLLNKNKEYLYKENKKDLKNGKRKGLSPAMIDRLTISESTIKSMIKGLKEVASLPCPVGKVYNQIERPNGLKINKIRVPIGVVTIIYESRPNVTVDAGAICLKSNNAVILRGGSESFNSNKALAKLFKQALEESNLPKEAVQLVPTTDRKAVELLLKRTKEIDLVIPRGGESLIKMVVEKSHIPVIKHYKGVCHVFVSNKGNVGMAKSITLNAKKQRPGVCNALETLLIDKRLAKKHQAEIILNLLDNGITIFGDAQTQKIDNRVKKATDADWETEYLDLRLSVKFVADIDEAIEHINKYGSHHTDTIITKSNAEADTFIKMVDSSSVIVNASTRFSDGGEYGMGCEIGISTDKLHARGPMGIDDLTTYKWVVHGTGQIRE